MDWRNSFDAVGPVGWFGAVAEDEGGAAGAAGALLCGAGDPIDRIPLTNRWRVLSRGWTLNRGRRGLGYTFRGRLRRFANSPIKYAGG